MAKAGTLGTMGASTTGNIKTTKNTAMVNFHGPMAVPIKVSGSKVSSTAWVCIHPVKAKKGMGNGEMASCTEIKKRKKKNKHKNKNKISDRITKYVTKLKSDYRL